MAQPSFGQALGRVESDFSATNIASQRVSTRTLSSQILAQEDGVVDEWSFNDSLEVVTFKAAKINQLVILTASFTALSGETVAVDEVIATAPSGWRPLLATPVVGGFDTTSAAFSIATNGRLTSPETSITDANQVAIHVVYSTQ